MASNNIQQEGMLPVGTILRGTYRIDGYLSSGGFGNTYVVTNIEFNERYAVKEFFMRGVNQRDEGQSSVSVSNSANRNSFDEQREKFKKEARRLRQLSNLHVVRVHDLFDENGTSYYVMDFIDGESLSDRLKRTGQPIPETEVRNYLLQILDGLEEIHNKGFQHLDLKPANIMVDKQGNITIIDFGASKQMRPDGGATASTAICYTPGYAPREQMEQNYEKFGPWTDLYALGATLYNILTTNKPPMASDIDDEGDAAFSFPSSVSDEMCSYILWLMQPNRTKRPQKVEKPTWKADKKKKVTKKAATPKVSKQLINPTSTTDEETVLNLPDTKFVDLALPSGTLWATMNIGAKNPVECGEYFAWGETSSKNEYCWKSYKWSNGSAYKLTKYCTNPHRGHVDDRLKLIKTDDVASIKWKKGCYIPTLVQWKELIKYCIWEWHNNEGVMGYEVISRRNGRSIFLPASGFFSESQIQKQNISGLYWSSNLRVDYVSRSHCLFFDSKQAEINSISRYYGCCIRPVIK